MTDPNEDKFERQLRRSRPAKPPDELLNRLLAIRPMTKGGDQQSQVDSSFSKYVGRLLRWLRWLVPATVAAVGAVLVWHGGYFSSLQITGRDAAPAVASAAVTPGLMADEVKIDQQLLSSFDAVARLPDGEPVRFRCENWMDQVVLSDKTKGLTVENRTPRFEVMPVGYETY